MQVILSTPWSQPVWVSDLPLYFILDIRGAPSVLPALLGGALPEGKPHRSLPLLPLPGIWQPPKHIRTGVWLWGCEGVVLWWLWVWGCDGVWVYENCRCDEVGKTYDQAYLLPLPLSRLPSVSPSFPFPFPSLLPPSLPPSFLASLLILKVILDGKKPSRDELELTASLLTPKGHRRVH